MLVDKRVNKDAIVQMAGQTFEELRAWCEAHPRYTLMDLEEQVVLLRQRLMGEMMDKLISEREAAQPAEGVKCAKCGKPMQDKGRRTRTVSGAEGPVELDRAYYYCPSCKEGFFPSGPGTEADPTPVD